MSSASGFRAPGGAALTGAALLLLLLLLGEVARVRRVLACNGALEVTGVARGLGVRRRAHRRRLSDSGSSWRPWPVEVLGGWVRLSRLE